MLDVRFEFALGKISFSQSNIIKINEVQSFNVGLQIKILCSIH